MTGISKSRMNFFKLRGSAVLETCSAETTVPWMTKMSRPESMMVLDIQAVRAGVTEADVVIPASFICLMRSATSSSLMGSKYICCMRAVALSSSSSRISSKSGIGSS